MIKAIVAVDNKWGIGKKNKLLANIPEDMKFFKKMTTGSVVIMGMNTFKSMNYKPLPNRQNIVICRTDETNLYSYDNLTFMNITEVKFYLLKNSNKNIFIIGGGATYNCFFGFCDLIYVTKIFNDYDADTFFRNLDEEEGWKESHSDPIVTKNNIIIQFCKYERINK